MPGQACGAPSSGLDDRAGAGSHQPGAHPHAQAQSQLSRALADSVNALRSAERALADERQRLQIVLQGTQAGTWAWHVPSGELRLDDRSAQILGETVAGLGPQTMALQRSRIHAQDLQACDAAAQAHLAGHTDGCETETRIRHRDGHWVWVLVRGRLLRPLPDGQPEWMCGTYQDISAQMNARLALCDAHTRMALAAEGSGIGVWDWDLQAGIIEVDATLCEMFGMPAQARVPQTGLHLHRVHPQDRAGARAAVVASLRGGLPLDHTCRIVRDDGGERILRTAARVTRDAGGQAVRMIGVNWDVTEQRRLSGEMSYRATHDPLTGLVNRSEFETRLRHLLSKSREDRSEHALLYIDLDQFKLINDACGHSAGDHLLQQVSKLLVDAVRQRDTLARLGGDEFAIILEHCTPEQAQRAAQQVCDRLEDYRFVHGRRRMRIGASIGLVPVDARWASPAAILQAADTACYAAKEAGRHRVHTWLDTDQTLRNRHGEMQWATRLEQALDDNHFVLHAQRICSLCAAPGQDHAEVLLRMVDANGGLVPPGAFLPAAERYNLITRIDRWVLRQVLAWMLPSPTAGEVQMLSVNLSGQSIGDRAFHRWAIDQLRQAGPALCRRLCLEVTETAAVTHMADAALFIDRVRALGVRVALDDFGAGASSFGYLKTLKVDFLKIDGQFIRKLIDDPLDEAAVRCFADVARLVGLQTVAEYVDNPAVLERLRSIGIDFAQGYLLHQPAPIDELRRQAQALPA